MSINERSMLPEQELAARHVGTHARLLAGPGTGKTLTLTRRVMTLIEQGVPPAEILIVTFTRAAAAELRGRVTRDQKRDQTVPRISTLHSFALRQLVRNSENVETLPRPFRVADDWEERNVIFEQLKRVLGYDVPVVRDLFNQLSADWENLEAEVPDWADKFIDPAFLGAWRDQRTAFGYTLRSELVYQVKRSLEQSGNFRLESEFKHLLVDEYQDLNRCDLAVIRSIADRGAEHFAAGDDDQSIYGFRKAHPEGIRKFPSDYTPSKSLTLSVCMRCDRRIVALAEFVANQDTGRIPKVLKPRPGAAPGEVHVLQFPYDNSEALGVSKICQFLIGVKGLQPRDILILVRSDRQGAYSSKLIDRLREDNLPVYSSVSDPLDTNGGRRFKAVTQLLSDHDDSLSICTWLLLTDRIGHATIQDLHQLASVDGQRISHAARRVQRDPKLLPRSGPRIKSALDDLDLVLDRWSERFTSGDGQAQLTRELTDLSSDLIHDVEERMKVRDFLIDQVRQSGVSDLSDLLSAMSSTRLDTEPDSSVDAINIMTMHKAKGLSAEAVIILGAEDELIPGKAVKSNEVADDRRLLYVSLTRARSHLYITYCDQRYGSQQYSGRTSGARNRRLTRFLADAPVRPSNGWAHIRRFAGLI